MFVFFNIFFAKKVNIFFLNIKVNGDDFQVWNLNGSAKNCCMCVKRIEMLFKNSFGPSLLNTDIIQILVLQLFSFGFPNFLFIFCIDNLNFLYDSSTARYSVKNIHFVH